LLVSVLFCYCNAAAGDGNFCNFAMIIEMATKIMTTDTYFIQLLTNQKDNEYSKNIALHTLFHSVNSLSEIATLTISDGDPHTVTT